MANNKGNKGNNNFKGAGSNGKNKDKKDNFKSKDSNPRPSSNSSNPRQPKDNRFSRFDKGSSNSTSNDPAWYKVDEQIYKDAGRVAFNNPLGMKVTGITDNGNDNYTFPGLAAIYYTPTCNEASEPNSAVNVSAKKLVSYLRSTVSTKLDFAAADAMMYLLAMDGVYSFYSYCVRLYGLHRSYISRNRYYPEVVYKAMGLTVTSTTDWNNFRAWLNIFAYKVSQLNVPSSMTYYARHMWMCSNVYLDAPDPKAQSYLFVPTAVYRWDGTSNPNGTQLVLEHIPSAVTSPSSDGTAKTLTDLQNFGDDLIDDILSDLDIGEFSGLIMRAFPNDLVKMNTIDEMFMIEPTYNPEVLLQIHNATICGKINHASSGTITQTEYDTLQVNYDSSCNNTSTLLHLKKDKLLDMPMEDPTPDDVFVATRLMVSGVVNSSDTAVSTLTHYGTEIVEFVRIYNNTAFIALESSVVTQTDPYGLNLLARASVFNFFPVLFVGHRATTEDPADHIYEVFGDIDNYTVLTTSELEKIHTAAALSLMTITSVR